METTSMPADDHSIVRHHTPTKKAGEFGRPLIPFFIDNESGATPTGGYSVNEELFLTDEQAQQQQRVFVPKGEKSIRVREFKDGYFEYKDLSFDSIQEKLTYDSPTKIQQPSKSSNNNQQFYAQPVVSSSPSSNPQGSSETLTNSNGKKRTSTRDHFANYEKMVVPFQHYNTKSNNPTSSSGSDSSSDEPPVINKKSSPYNNANISGATIVKKKKKMIPVNVQKQSSTSKQQQNVVTKTAPMTQQIPFAQPPIMIIPFNPPSPTYVNPHSNFIPSPLINPTTQILPNYIPQQGNSEVLSGKLITPSALKGTIKGNITKTVSTGKTVAFNGLITPSALRSSQPLPQPLPFFASSEPIATTNKTYQNPTPVIYQNSEQHIDVSDLENSLQEAARMIQTGQPTYAPHFVEPSQTSIPSTVAQPMIMSSLHPSNSTSSLTEEELITSLMNDGSVNLPQDLEKSDTENSEQKKSEKKFAGGSWSNSPHPSKIPKPNFK